MTAPSVARLSLSQVTLRDTISHTGETEFACNHCDKAFSQLDNLKRHTISHTGETEFACDQCDKAFSQLDNLKTHKLSHTTEKL